MGKVLLILLGAAIGASSLLAQPVITNQPISQTVIYGSNATFSVMVTGVGPLTYQWQMNGTNLPNNIVTTIAGGKLNDGLAATNTILNAPQSVAVDGAGNLFIADMYNGVIRKVGTNGVSQIVAGNGVAGVGGDGGAATNAFFGSPAAVAVDTNGNFFIADMGGNRIRKVDTNGVIITVAGNGSPFGSGNTSFATNFGLNSPSGVAVDNAGNFYIADTYNQEICKVTSSGTITRVAGQAGGPGLGGYTGDGSPATGYKLNNPSGVAVDGVGNIFIADTSNNRIRKVTTSGTISTIAGNGTTGYSGDGGSATSAKLNAPNAVCLETNGNIYVTDTGNHCVRKITNGIISTVAGNGVEGFSGDGGAATSANLALPAGVAMDKTGNLFVADWSQRIRKITNGIITTVAGRNPNDGEVATNAILNSPTQAAQDAAGNYYICDSGNHRIRKIDTNGIVSTIAGDGFPRFAGDGGPATNASLYFPNGVVLDAAGNVFISDAYNRRIRKVDTNGMMSTVAGKGTSGYSGDGGAATNAGFYPAALAVDTSGNIFIADSGRVRKVDTNGNINTIAGKGTLFGYSGEGGQATNAVIGSPNAIAISASGNLFIGSSTLQRILKMDTNGIIKSVAGGGYGYAGDGGAATNAQLEEIDGIAVDPVENLYFADSSLSRIRKVGTNGIITTVIGNGTMIYPTDNVPGSIAGLSGPRKMWVDANGNLMYVDQGANRLRKVSNLESADQPSFTITNATVASTSNIYSVVITSASGSVTSSVVSVNLQLPPVTPVFSAASNAVTFTWSAISNLTYQLQSATNLTAPAWQNLGNPVTATNGTVSTLDIPAGVPQRFYRVQLVQ